MTPNQVLCSRARDNLVFGATGLGFSAELAELLARELGSPKASEREASYVWLMESLR